MKEGKYGSKEGRRDARKKQSRAEQEGRGRSKPGEGERGPQNRFHGLGGPGTNDPPISASWNRVCARAEENVLLETPGAPLGLSRTKRKLD